MLWFNVVRKARENLSFFITSSYLPPLQSIEVLFLFRAPKSYKYEILFLVYPCVPEFGLNPRQEWVPRDGECLEPRNKNLQ